MTLDGTAQVAAAHCPNERSLDRAVCSYKSGLVANMIGVSETV